MRMFLAPLGVRAARFQTTLNTEARLQEGLLLLLPGIDGRTSISDNIARGLVANGFRGAVEVYDWRSFRGWNPLHLATSRRNHNSAAAISRRIVEYSEQYPNCPIHLVGHSAGAGMALFVLENLPVHVQVESCVLLAAAISRKFNAARLSEHTRNGIWNFWSRGDLPTVGLGTMIFGTMDRRHAASAGAFGFSAPQSNSGDSQDRIAAQRLHDVGYSFRMAGCWNFGGHFGCTNTAFVSRYVAPIVSGSVQNSAELMAQPG